MAAQRAGIATGLKNIFHPQFSSPFFPRFFRVFYAFFTRFLRAFYTTYARTLFACQYAARACS
jgi:hypothetical protein